MKYKCYVELVPKGKPPRRSDTIKIVKFKHDNLKKSEILSRLYEITDKRKSLNPYVIRNHWEVFEVDAEFENPPWDRFAELSGKLISFDEATGWKSSGSELYISTRKGKVKDYIRKVENYYQPLNPRIEQSGIVAVDAKPVVRD